MTGYQTLHMKLARVGFSLSYDETRRYNCSVMHLYPEYDNGDTESNNPVPIMHFVADNVDHNIGTLDGLGTFHGMGIIATSVFPQGVFGKKERVVRRLNKSVKACESASNSRVQIISYENFDRKGIKGVKLEEIHRLKQSHELPTITKLNVLWHAAGMQSSRSDR